MTLISKKQFLEEHNKLSPSHLQANLAMLTRFQQEKKPQLAEDGWCLDKLRIPFISWLVASKEQPEKKEKKPNKTNKKREYRIYPDMDAIES